jgi:catechol 2,3-dioxygenase-like lactoylglutathione lyase family enzyme
VNRNFEEEFFMRGLYLFVAGILVGLAVQIAFAQNQDRGIIGLNHVGISVSDVDEAVTYYTETLGFPEAFRLVDQMGQPALVYVQVSANTFVELQAANAQRPPGISHFGVHVANMAEATATFSERGANVGETRVGSTKAILSDISDPNGIRMELLEIPPESLTGQAIVRWQ